MEAGYTILFEIMIFEGETSRKITNAVIDSRALPLASAGNLEENTSAH